METIRERTTIFADVKGENIFKVKEEVIAPNNLLKVRLDMTPIMIKGRPIQLAQKNPTWLLEGSNGVLSFQASIMLAESVRGLGIGTHLMNRLIEIAKEYEGDGEIRNIYLSAVDESEENTKRRDRLYERFGFKFGKEGFGGASVKDILLVEEGRYQELDLGALLGDLDNRLKSSTAKIKGQENKIGGLVEKVESSVHVLWQYGAAVLGVVLLVCLSR